MTRDEREELRRRIDAARRRRITGACEIYGPAVNPETSYRRGCRCDYCRYGQAEAVRARRTRRRRRLELEAAS